MSTQSSSSLARAARWFNPRGRSINTLAFMLNRITALGLVVYLFMHLAVLSQLAMGPAQYDIFLSMIHNPLFVAAELLVVAAVFIHGLNGIRIFLTSFGIAVPYQKQMFLVLMVIGLLFIAWFGVTMFDF